VGTVEMGTLEQRERILGEKRLELLGFTKDWAAEQVNTSEVRARGLAGEIE
jgi:hypothetical protein